MRWGHEDFSLLIQTLPTFWAEQIWILRISIFEMLLDPKFQEIQVPRFPKSGLGCACWALGLGRALGPVGPSGAGWALGQAGTLFEGCKLGHDPWCNGGDGPTRARFWSAAVIKPYWTVILGQF